MSQATRPPVKAPELPDHTYVEFLSSGGFADVFRYERHFPRQNVAIKVLWRGDASLRADFINEADSPSSLSGHPNSLTIHRTALQLLHRLLLIRFHPVMLLLPAHVGAPSFQTGRADGESTIAFLPRESRDPQFVMHPF